MVYGTICGESNGGSSCDVGSGGLRVGLRSVAAKVDALHVGDLQVFNQSSVDIRDNCQASRSLDREIDSCSFV